MSTSLPRNVHPWGAMAAALPIAGRKISPTAPYLVTKSRQDRREAAELFARSQLECMAGIWLLKDRKQLIPR